MNRKMLDLCSGLGGASEAMLNHGWEVARIENNPLLQMVPNTTIMSIQQLRDDIKSQLSAGVKPADIELVWASPPCIDFSLGYHSPRSKAIRAGEDYYPAYGIELVQICKEIIDMLQPRYWMIENVRGAIQYLEPILGPPKMIIDSIVIWGKFPSFAMPPDYKHVKDDSKWSNDPLRANARALIPYEVSNAIRQSIEAQKTLTYWF